MSKKLSHGYSTSKNYSELFELIKEQRIVCFVNVKDYIDKDGYKLQDICQSQVRYDDEMVEICARGISYISAFSFKKLSIKEDFIEQCKGYELEFIQPTKRIIK